VEALITTVEAQNQVIQNLTQVNSQLTMQLMMQNPNPYPNFEDSSENQPDEIVEQDFDPIRFLEEQDEENVG